MSGLAQRGSSVAFSKKAVFIKDGSWRCSLGASLGCRQEDGSSSFLGTTSRTSFQSKWMNSFYWRRSYVTESWVKKQELMTTGHFCRRWVQSTSEKSREISTKQQPRPPPQQQEEASRSRLNRSPIRPYPQSQTIGSKLKSVPSNIPKPPYAKSGVVPQVDLTRIILHNRESANRMRAAARLARQALDLACTVAIPGMTTDQVDTIVHNALIEAGAYPSPLNYSRFPKSLCSSINEVICHGIPDSRPLQFGDVVSFDVSCFFNGVHGDNCATIIVGDMKEGFDLSTAVAVDDRAHGSDNSKDWRGVPYNTNMLPEEEEFFQTARRLVRATRESLYAAIEQCRPGGCLSHIGSAIHQVADDYGFSSVQTYRGHGIAHDFHCGPLVKHFRNNDRLKLVPGMIFTIEPMLVVGNQDCYEWPDGWTVVTCDGSLAAQFEHTVLITEDSVEILTISEPFDKQI